MAKTAPLIEERFREVPVIEPGHPWRSTLKVALGAAPARRNRSGIAGLVPALLDTLVDGTPSPQLPDADACNVCAQVEAATLS
jgi:hypothetical protein